MIEEILSRFMLMLDDPTAPVVKLVAQRMGLSVLEDFFVNRERPVTFQKRLVYGLVESYLECLGSSTFPPYPTHVIQARDDAEALPDFECIGRPIEHAIDVIHDHKRGLPPTFKLRKDRANVARRRLNCHGFADIAQTDGEDIFCG